MAIEYVQEIVPLIDNKGGLIVYKPKELVSGKKYPFVIFLPGIGERGNGSAKDLEKLRSNGSVDTLERGCREHEIILVEVQPKDNYQHGEVNRGYQYGLDTLKDNIDWTKVMLTGLSLGGGGVYRYLAENPEAHIKFTVATPMCAGPLLYFVADQFWKNLVNTKVPIWAFHNTGDTTAPAIQSTILMKNKIRDMKGTAIQYTTMYSRSGHTWPAYGFYGEAPAATPSLATDFNTTTFNIYNWLEINTIGKPPIYPDGLKPSPEPVSVPSYITGVWTEGAIKAAHDAIAVVYFDDGTQLTYKAPLGDRVSGIWVSRKNDKITFNMTFGKTPPLWLDRKPK